MGTLLDLASLVVVPSGYKAGTVYSVKPTDGTGDLVFTRSLDTATRVGPDGLIEKVRTNLVLQSNDFGNAAWTKIGASVTQGATAPDGTTTAWTFQSIAAGTAQISVAITGTNTLSIFAKAGNISVFSLWIGSAVTFNLATGVVTAGTGSMVNVGNGWYRCIVPFTSAGSFNPFINASASGENVLIAFAQQETGDIATPYIPTTTAAVSVGMLANVPRLDYTGGGCPKLLLEPQRTNLVTFSEQLNNAAWTKNVSVTANVIASPDGTTNADKLVESASSVEQWAYQGLSLSGAQTISIYAKKAERNFVALATSGLNASYFNLDTGVVVSAAAGATASIVNAGNGWYRCSVTSTTSTSNFAIVYVSDNGTRTSYAGDITKGIYVWGAQQEAGAYATSYIPTLGAAVTRSADLASKTGISALIGQTEGTLFWEFEFSNSAATGHESLLNIDNGSFGSTFYISKSSSGGIVGEMYNGGVLQASFLLSSQPAGTYKAALAYANNNTAFFVNGVQVGTTDTSCSVPATSRLQLGNTALGPSTDKTAQVLLFPTRLSNSDLAALTA